MMLNSVPIRKCHLKKDSSARDNYSPIMLNYEMTSEKIVQLQTIMLNSVTIMKWHLLKDSSARDNSYWMIHSFSDYYEITSLKDSSA